MVIPGKGSKEQRHNLWKTKSSFVFTLAGPRSDWRVHCSFFFRGRILRHAPRITRQRSLALRLCPAKTESERLDEVERKYEENVLVLVGEEKKQRRRVGVLRIDDQ